MSRKYEVCIVFDVSNTRGLVSSLSAGAVAGRRRNQLEGGANRATPRLDFWKESKCKCRERILEKNILLSCISVNTGLGLIVSL
jgi:hypothetical protein